MTEPRELTRFRIQYLPYRSEDGHAPESWRVDDYQQRTTVANFYDKKDAEDYIALRQRLEHHEYALLQIRKALGLSLHSNDDLVEVCQRVIAQLASVERERDEAIDAHRLACNQANVLALTNERLVKNGKRVADLIELGYKLSTYAACSKISNTPEFLTDLLRKIEKYQASYKAALAGEEGYEKEENGNRSY